MNNKLLSLSKPILLRTDSETGGPKPGLYIRRDGAVLLLEEEEDPDRACEPREVTLHEALDWWKEALDREYETTWDCDGQIAFMAKLQATLKTGCAGELQPHLN